MASKKRPPKRTANKKSPTKAKARTKKTAKPSPTRRKRAAPTREVATHPVDADATVQVSIEVTQTVPVAEVLGDIEETLALDGLTEQD